MLTNVILVCTRRLALIFYNLLVCAVPLKKRLFLVLLLGALDELDFLVDICDVGLCLVEDRSARLHELLDALELLFGLCAHLLHLSVVLANALLHAFLTCKDLSIGELELIEVAAVTGVHSRFLYGLSQQRRWLHLIYLCQVKSKG